MRGVVEGECAHDKAENLVDLHRRVAQVHQARPQRLVGDFKVATTRQLFEFNEGEVRFDTGGIAIHQQADGSGGGDDGGLSVAKAGLFGGSQCAIPAFAGGGE